MRPTLALALVLLALTLAVEHAPDLFRRRAGTGADRALEILVGAKGPLLPAAAIGSGPERLGSVLRLGDRTLLPAGPHGLHAAVVGTDCVPRSERLYDVASAPADAEELATAVAGARDGELLVIASRGRLESAAGPPSAAFERALLQIGARAHPGGSTPESWAYIGLRTESGWVPLAEGYSTDSGVALAFVVGSDLERYAEFRGDLVHARAGSRREIDLLDELPYATRCTEGVVLARNRMVRGQPIPGLLVPPRVGAGGVLRPGEIAWEGVAVGDGSCVYALLGLTDRAGAESDGVVFQVWFDGELVDGRSVQADSRLRPKLFDLRRFAGRTGTLALVVEPRASATGDEALFGRPLLLHGYERSPLEVWAEERN